MVHDQSNMISPEIVHTEIPPTISKEVSSLELAHVPQNPRKDGLLYVSRLALALFLSTQAGMSDGSLGAQLDSIQFHYNLSYSAVSLIFLANVAGWFVGSFLNIYLLHYVGLWGTLCIASLLNLVGAVVSVVTPPFPAFIVALLITGLGAGLNDLSLATYLAHFKNGPMMSIFYAALGAGALIAPLIVAAMLDHGVAWNIYYYVPLGTSIISLPLVWIIFRGYIPPEEREAKTTAGGRLLLAIRSPMVLFGGLSAALSLSSADIISSWLVSFMTTIRHGNSVTMRYVLAGFLGGQVVGRLVLSHATSRAGERFALSVYGAIAIGLLAVIQFVDNIPGNAVAVTFVGIFFGPSTPTIISLASKRVQPSLISSAVSLVMAIGLIGAAVGPLVVGFVNSAGGLRYLSAIVMVLVGLLLALWHLVPLTMAKVNIDQTD